MKILNLVLYVDRVVNFSLRYFNTYCKIMLLAHLNLCCSILKEFRAGFEPML